MRKEEGATGEHRPAPCLNGVMMDREDEAFGAEPTQMCITYVLSSQKASRVHLRIFQSPGPFLDNSDMS